MLDLKLIRAEPDKVKAGLVAKGLAPKLIDEILPLAEESARLQARLEKLRADRHQAAKAGRVGESAGRQIKQDLEDALRRARDVNARLTDLLLQVPNLPAESVVVGDGESANTIEKTVGEPPRLNEPFDHLAIAEKFGLIDIPRGAKVAESRFNYLKNQAVAIEFGLIRLAFDICASHGFTPMITPTLVNRRTVEGTGYLPYYSEEVYTISDGLYLIGTSELALVGYHRDEIIEPPVRYVGFSSCFRREAGSYGRDTRGIFRQHQFDKVEMVSFVPPEQSEAELKSILATEEEIMAALELPYQIVAMGTGDLGFQAARKFDIETWLPSQNRYRETHSCSNTTDFQSRRLNIRYRGSNGTALVHTLNGTAVAIGRTLIALLENGQRDDATVRLPTRLAAHCGFDTIG